MEQNNHNARLFITNKELANVYGLSLRSLRYELSKIKQLGRKPFQRVYNKNEQQIIYNHLGNPFEQ